MRSALSRKRLSELGRGADLGPLPVKDEDGDDDENAEEAEEGGGPFEGVGTEVGVYCGCGKCALRSYDDDEVCELKDMEQEAKVIVSIHPYRTMLEKEGTYEALRTSPKCQR